ncbi:MAG: hypothetical protein A2041_11340 [Bacteroidetes bacterium GWA2_31_9b]|nr:MAG: hypothetical protein A2041_11340 [Bacteroidetes bacterium GWA2_31_9b]
MELNLYEEFILLSLDKVKGKFLIDALSVNYGLAGAILLQLSQNENIIIDNKKIKLKNKKQTGDKILNNTLDLILKSKKYRNAKYWVNKIGSKAGSTRNDILVQLCDKKLIKVQKNKFLWIFRYTNYPIINSDQVDEIIVRLKDIVLNYQKPDINSVLLLSLMNSCKLTRILFIDKKDHKIANKRIKELTKDIEIGEAVSQTIKEIQTAVLVASTSVFLAAGASNT